VFKFITHDSKSVGSYIVGGFIWGFLQLLGVGNKATQPSNRACVTAKNYSRGAQKSL
jgi:hypothetical protein